jgi:hypothetical protein
LYSRASITTPRAASAGAGQPWKNGTFERP